MPLPRRSLPRPALFRFVGRWTSLPPSRPRVASSGWLRPPARRLQPARPLSLLCSSAPSSKTTTSSGQPPRASTRRPPQLIALPAGAQAMTREQSSSPRAAPSPQPGRPAPTLACFPAIQPGGYRTRRLLRNPTCRLSQCRLPRNPARPASPASAPRPPHHNPARQLFVHRLLSHPAPADSSRAGFSCPRCSAAACRCSMRKRESKKRTRMEIKRDAGCEKSV